MVEINSFHVGSLGDQMPLFVDALARFFGQTYPAWTAVEWRVYNFQALVEVKATALAASSIEETRHMQFTVKELWRYPVKSMRGESHETVEVTANGITFDRGWALRDDEARTIRGGKFLGELMECSARYLSEQPTGDLKVPHARVTLPNGMEINTDDDQIRPHPRVPIPIYGPSPCSRSAGGERGLLPRINTLETSDFTSEIRKIFSLKDDEPLPDLAQIPPKLLRQLTDFTSSSDLATPVHQHLAKPPAPHADLSARRPNSTCTGSIGILVSDGRQRFGLLEEQWLGKNVQIGAVEFNVVVRAPRCIMVTRAQRPPQRSRRSCARW